MVEIKNINGEVIATVDMENLRGADLRCADLRGADLRYADLRSADLRSADLRYADLRGAGILVLTLPIWTVYVHNNAVRIGCQHHTHEEWKKFTDEEIAEMDDKALEWWHKYKPLIIAAMDAVSL